MATAMQDLNDLYFFTRVVFPSRRGLLPAVRGLVDALSRGYQVAIQPRSAGMDGVELTDASRVAIGGGSARDLHETLSGTAAQAETVGSPGAALFFRPSFDFYSRWRWHEQARRDRSRIARSLAHAACVRGA
ncbi:MAG: hypothetical protein Q8O08_16305 [Methyloversatilis sp.]|nr:hypothetical protein [Methyloversatilis sp.]MDP2870384.1 hypothetical protein [Methyloversatilis sp.]